MEMGDVFEAGKDIMDQVSEAINTGNYQDLAGTVQDSASKVMGRTAEKKTGETTEKAASRSREKNYFLRKRPDRGKGRGRRIAGIVLGIFPGLMTALFVLAIPIYVMTGADAAEVGVSVFFALFFGLITFAFAMLARSGKRQQELVKRYYEYGSLVGTGKEYIAVSELADKAGVTQDQIRKDILAMRAEGYLPYAVLDRMGTTVILTDEMYQQYARAEQSRAKREEEERVRRLQEEGTVQGTGETWETAAQNVAQADARSRAQEEAAKAQSAQKKESSQKGQKAEAKSESEKLLAEGEAYILEIRAINDRIPDTEEMSAKLYRLEDIIRRIFEQVEKHPDNAKDLRKLMEYYLPTTTKLLNAYAELNEQPEAGENIRETKHQIESSMDAINGAFEKLLDDLFQEQAWDLSSDLNVMKTMMAQDGLAKITSV